MGILFIYTPLPHIIKHGAGALLHSVLQGAGSLAGLLIAGYVYSNLIAVRIVNII